MSTQCKAEIDLILSTCTRLKLSGTIFPRTPMKSKIGGKILSQKHVNKALIANFHFSEILVQA